MRALITTIVGTLAPASAFAAASNLTADNSWMFVWVFLGFSALIVVAQVVPALLLLTGMVKGVVSVVKEELAPVASRNS
jgi:hypothetical protein